MPNNRVAQLEILEKYRLEDLNKVFDKAEKELKLNESKEYDDFGAKIKITHEEDRYYMEFVK